MATHVTGDVQWADCAKSCLHSGHEHCLHNAVLVCGGDAAGDVATAAILTPYKGQVRNSVAAWLLK